MNPNAMWAGQRLRRWAWSLQACAMITATMASGATSLSNWPRWRGPQDNGGNESGSYPVQWDATNGVLWKAPLPGKGCSTPIVWENRIFLTAPANGQDAVLGLDGSGQQLWQTTLGPERPGKHQNGSGSNPSPATDGHGLFVYFKSGTLAALEFDGKVRWQTNLVERFGRDTLFWDHGTSPVLTEKFVVLARMHTGDSWLAAFDKRTGEMRWLEARNYQTPVEGDQSYTTPLVVRREGQEMILVLGAERVTAHAADTGKLVWTYGGLNPKGRGYLPTVASPLIEGELLIVPHGRDRDSTLHAIKLGGSGDVTASHRAWKRDDTGTFVPTPAAYRGRLYVLRDRGEVECLDPVTGRTVWSGALPKASSSYYASPAVAGGQLYAVREDGVIFVARAEGSFEILAENRLGERVIASPVPVSNRLLLRGEKHLFCVATPQP